MPTRAAAQAAVEQERSMPMEEIIELLEQRENAVESTAGVDQASLDRPRSAEQPDVVSSSVTEHADEDTALLLEVEELNAR